MNFENETAEEDVWDGKDADAFVAERVGTHPTYAHVVQILQDSGKDTHLVRNFVSRVAYDTALETTSKLDQHMAAVLRDVTDSEHEYQVKIWLTGITLNEDAVRVSDSLLFRRPTRADFQEKARAEDIQFAHAGFMGRVYFSCIGDCRVSARQPVEFQRFVERLITALRLFRLGSVSAARYDYRADSFSIFADGRLVGPQRAPRLEYTLSCEDVSELSRALQVLTPVIPSIYDLPETKSHFLSTALDWYGQSLLAGGPVEGTIAWAIACLEALFLGDNPATELSYRLTHRVIALLRCFGWVPLETRKVLKTAYDVRSKYVHGAVSKRVSREEMSALHRNVAECARVSCLIWTQLLAARKRDELLATLEDALIDDTASLRLREWCKGVDFARKP